MKILMYLCVLLWAGGNIDIGKIAKINQLKEEAANAYKNGNYNVAINRYEELVKLGVDENPVLLNLAHAYFNTRDTTNALKAYSRLLISTDKYSKSVANQQMGVIKANNKSYEDALKFFKESLKAMPENEEARHNYELVKKLLEQQKKQQEQQNQNKDNKDKQQQEKEKQEQQQKEQQQKQEQQQNEQGDKKENADKKEQEGKDDKKEEKKEGQQDEQSEKKGKEEEKESKEKRSQRLQQMNLTEDQAKTILDAMKNNEVQYLQQNKKRPTKKPEKGKPDW
jgi:DNA polymerase III gamma/tau subunit